MSDTPRTNGNVIYVKKIDDLHIQLVNALFAQELERELNAANERIKRLEEAGDDIFLLAQKHAPEYWLYTQTAFNNWRKARRPND